MSWPTAPANTYRNRLGRLMAKHDISEQRLAVACVPEMPQKHINAIKNGRVNLTLGTAWKIVRALRKLSGEHYTFEDVWPEEKERR